MVLFHFMFQPAAIEETRYNKTSKQKARVSAYSNETSAYIRDHDIPYRQPVIIRTHLFVPVQRGGQALASGAIEDDPSLRLPDIRMLETTNAQHPVFPPGTVSTRALDQYT